MSTALVLPVEQLCYVPTDARREAERWARILEPLIAMKQRGERGVTRAFAQVGKAAGVPATTVKAKYYDFIERGPEALINKSLCGPTHWNTLDKGLPKAVIELFKTLCERNQRKCAPAYRRLVDMWAQKAPELGRIYPGFPGWPDLPPGWSERNLMRFRPTDAELTLSRIGKTAFRRYIPKVLTTRVGLLVGQCYMPDDQDYDVHVGTIGANLRMSRPSGFNTLDLSSACEFAQGYKPTILNADGTKQKLRQVDYQWHLVHILTTIGYRADVGTVIIGEHGTANSGSDFEERVYAATGGKVVFDASGIHGKQMPSLFRGQPRGNPAYKATRESWFNLLRNEMAALPGQTGKDRHHAPEENYGLQLYVRDMLTVMETHPEIADFVRLPVLRFDEFLFAVEAIVRRINERTDHDIEGWEKLRRVTFRWRMAPATPWLDAKAYDSLPAPQRAVVDALVQQNPRDLWQYRKLSPLEVWEAGKGELTRVSGSAIPVLLGPEAARAVTITEDHHIEIKDQEIAFGTMAFDSALTNGRILPHGATFHAYLNPYDPSRLQMCDVDGRYLGEAPAIELVGKLDTEAAVRRAGRVAHIAGRLEEPVIKRARDVIRERTEMRDHNSRLLTDTTPEGKARARSRQALEDKADAALARRVEENPLSELPETYELPNDDDSY